MTYNPDIDWSKKTGMMLGRFQPWNSGHRAMFKQIAGLPFSNHRDKSKTTPRQIVIMVRHQPDGKYTIGNQDEHEILAFEESWKQTIHQQCS